MIFSSTWEDNALRFWLAGYGIGSKLQVFLTGKIMTYVNQGLQATATRRKKKDIIREDECAKEFTLNVTAELWLLQKI